MHPRFTVGLFFSLFGVFGVFANPVDEQYIALVQNILENGEYRDDRTKTGTVALFAPPPLVFDVSHEAFPLLTTKKVNFRLIAEELFWMLSGSSCVKDLQDKNVKIWNGNANEEGRAGMYGQQWRYFGASYHPDTEEMMAEPHVDQIANMIDLIMHNPTSRRILVSAWNSLEIEQSPGILPPCHWAFQIYVRNNGKLDMMVNQRSVDSAIGLPFNLASYSLLLLLIAHVTDKVAGKITYVMGDTHIYKNTIDPILTQITREPFPLPQLYFTTGIPRGSGLAGLLAFDYANLRLDNYKSHPVIRMIMSA